MYKQDYMGMKRPNPWHVRTAWSVTHRLC